MNMEWGLRKRRGKRKRGRCSGERQSEPAALTLTLSQRERGPDGNSP
jgi:hypothetical protein